MTTSLYTNFGTASALAAALVTLIFIYTRHKFGYWLRRGLPSIEPSFPFGNFRPTFLRRASIADRTAALYRQTSAACVGLWIGLRPVLLVRDSQLIREILIKDFAAFHDRGVFSDPQREPLTGNIFALSGDRWRPLRHKFSPAFTAGKLRTMFPTLVACGGPLERHLRDRADNENVVEMRELMAQFTANIIASVTFGLDIDCIADPGTAFRHFGRKLLAPGLWNSVRGMVTFFLPKWFAFLRLRAFDADVEQFFLSIVAQNMLLRETSGETRKDFFQLLVQLRNGGAVQEDGEWTARNDSVKQLSMEECAAQCLAFFVAGFETSSSTMSFTLYELAKNAELQRRVQREIDSVLARHDGKLTYESLLEMKYLEMCIDGKYNNKYDLR